MGMMRELVDTSPAARSIMSEADDVLDMALSTLCFNGPDAALTDTINAQPALLAAGIAVLRALAERLVEALPAVRNSAGHESGVRFVAGHSLGEYTALVAANRITFADGLRLVRERGRLMQEAGAAQPGRMAAVLGLDREQVEAVCAQASDAGVVQVANDNCPGQIVISGSEAGVEAAMATLTEAGARRVVPLNVSVASHSPLMESAAHALRDAIDSTPIAAPQEALNVPLIANTSARPLTDAASIRKELVAQLTGSVRWSDSMRFALEQGITHFVELGPGDVLGGLMRRIDRKAARVSLNDPQSIDAFVATIAEVHSAAA